MYEIVKVDGRLRVQKSGKDLTYEELTIEFARLLGSVDGTRLTYLDRGELGGIPRYESQWYLENYKLRRQIRVLLLALEDKQEWDARRAREPGEPTVEEKLLAFRELAARRLEQLQSLRSEYTNLVRVQTLKNRALEALGFPWGGIYQVPDGTKRPGFTQQMLEDLVHTARHTVGQWNFLISMGRQEGTKVDWDDPKFSGRMK